MLKKVIIKPVLVLKKKWKKKYRRMSSMLPSANYLTHCYYNPQWDDITHDHIL